MTIAFDANPNPSTKAMQAQEEGRGLAFLRRKSQFRDSKMRRKNTNSRQILSERASNRSATSNSSVKIVCLNSSQGSSSILKSSEFIAQNACKIIRQKRLRTNPNKFYLLTSFIYREKFNIFQQVLIVHYNLNTKIKKFYS